MQEASILLRDGMSVDEVAAGMGYGWPSSFTVAYQRFHGTAPSEHKKRRAGK